MGSGGAPAGPARFEGTWTAGTVARYLGVAESTLRSWHRRYGLGPHTSPPGRYRRYSAPDVALLERMRDLIAAGTLPSDAAREVLRTAGEWPETADPVGELVAAAEDLDSARCLTLLRRALPAAGAAEVWERLCRPAMRAIERAQAGHGRCPDAEHVLSWTIQAVLASVAAAGLSDAAVGRRPQVLLACLAGERHTLPLDALAAVLAERGFDVRMLGADTPVEALTNAVAVCGPAAVAVWSQEGGDHEPVVSAARGWRAPLVTAGPGWPAGSPRRVGGLPEAVTVLEEIAGPPGEGQRDRSS